MLRDRTTRPWAGRVLLALLALALLAPCAGPERARAEDGLCAKVKLEIAQELTLERQAFDAHMRITNGLSLELKDVRVTVNFTDEAGTPVLATTDPNITTAAFFLRVDSLSNVSAVEGNGTVAGATTADIHWLIIPSQGAAKGLPSGTLYYVGATLTYTLGGKAETVEVSPDYIFVKPMPNLALDYFLPGEVYGDDPPTGETETPVPFALGVRVSNTGQGIARSVKIDSGQPQIVHPIENESDQGLLVSFRILGSEVNGNPATSSLLADFGDIAPNASSVARWTMTSSLSGTFSAFTASYTHSDELGGALTSLVDDPHTHILVWDVLVDLPGRDGVRDFLAEDGPGTFKVYESEHLDSDVAAAAGSLSAGDPSGTQFSHALSLTSFAPVGFSYLKIQDPHGGAKVIRSVTRSDGKRIKLENAWLSKARKESDHSQWDLLLQPLRRRLHGLLHRGLRHPDRPARRAGVRRRERPDCGGGGRDRDA